MSPTTLARGLALLGALALGCSGGASAEPDRADVPRFDPSQHRGCVLTLALEAGPVAEAGRRAIERINAATGCHLSESDDGLPVVSEPVVVHTYTKAPACGITYMTVMGPKRRLLSVDRIALSTDLPGCFDLESTLVHELFHAMTGESQIHSRSGVFFENAHDPIIDAGTLETVCSAMWCPAFVPEVSRPCHPCRRC